MVEEHPIDFESYKQTLLQIPSHIEYSMKQISSFQTERDFSNIVFVGMGGSGFIGDFCKAYLSKISKPVFVIKDYTTPDYIQSNSLVFILSYSGNTDETLEVYRRVMQRKATVVSMSCGGKVEQLSRMYENVHIKIPGDIQPRQAIGYFIPPILKVLEYIKLIGNVDTQLKTVIQSLRKDIFESYAQDLVQKSKGTIPIFYGSNYFAPIAYAWKTHTNETAKIPSFSNVLPECFHNEIACYDSLNAQSHCSYFLLHDASETDKRLLKKISQFYILLKEKNLICQEIVIRGENTLSRMFSALYLGMWYSFYLAQELNIDPTRIDVIEKFKQKTK